MNDIEYDISIIGGGIVGLATAYKLQKKFPSMRLILLEKEKELAFHQTGRNSGVIHSGLYYKPNSMRARNCMKGRDQLVSFAKQHKIQHDVCGKIILASNQDEFIRLSYLKENGEKNGLKNLKILTMDQVKRIEPFVEGSGGLYVPQSGIINYKQVAYKLSELIQLINPESKIETNCKVIDIENRVLFSTKGKIRSRYSIFCGGLFSDRLAKKDRLKLNMKIVGFRGDYYELKETSKHKIKNLVYPVPNPDFPFLGVHFTRMVDGSVECGPNAVFTFKREGYKRTDFNFMDTLDALSFIGTMRLFINHWKFGVKEYRRSFSKRLFLRDLKRMIPSLKRDDIKRSKSGVRAMALAKDGSLVDDFMIVKNRNNIHVLNAPSPAATACLSIGDEIVRSAIKNFKL